MIWRILSMLTIIAGIAFALTIVFAAGAAWNENQIRDDIEEKGYYEIRRYGRIGKIDED